MKFYVHFYGNEISYNDQCGSFNTCNGVNSFYVNKSFYELYFKWQRDKYKFHISQYYNMYYACDMYLNGKCLNQQESVPHSCVTHFGLDKLDLSERNTVEMKVSALLSPQPVRKPLAKE